MHYAIGLETAADVGGLGEALTASEVTPCARKHGKLLPLHGGMRKRLRAQAFFCNAYAEELKLTSSCLKHISTQLQQANLSALSRHQYRYSCDHASAHPHSPRQGFILQGGSAREWLPVYDANAF